MWRSHFTCPINNSHTPRRSPRSRSVAYDDRVASLRFFAWFGVCLQITACVFATPLRTWFSRRHAFIERTSVFTTGIRRCCNPQIWQASFQSNRCSDEFDPDGIDFWHTIGIFQFSRSRIRNGMCTSRIHFRPKALWSKTKKTRKRHPRRVGAKGWEGGGAKFRSFFFPSWPQISWISSLLGVFPWNCERENSTQSARLGFAGVTTKGGHSRDPWALNGLLWSSNNHDVSSSDFPQNACDGWNKRIRSRDMQLSGEHVHNFFMGWKTTNSFLPFVQCDWCFTPSWFTILLNITRVGSPTHNWRDNRTSNASKWHESQRKSPTTQLTNFCAFGHKNRKHKCLKKLRWVFRVSHRGSNKHEDLQYKAWLRVGKIAVSCHYIHARAQQHQFGSRPNMTVPKAVQEGRSTHNH